MSAEELRAKIREIPDFPKPGILFYDITTLLKDPEAYQEAIDLMLAPYMDERSTSWSAWSRAASSSARRWPTSWAPASSRCASWASCRPRRSRVEYALEYGSNTLEIHRDAIQPGQRVLIVDDLLATGGTVRGTIELVERLQGEVVGPGVPRRAGLPQGPRPARRAPGHERHPVLTAAERARRRTHGATRRPAGRPTRPRRGRARARTAAPPVAGATHRTSTSAARSSASSPASSSRPPRRSPAPPRRSSARRPRRPRASSTRPPAPRMLAGAVAGGAGRTGGRADRLPDAVPLRTTASCT